MAKRQRPVPDARSLIFAAAVTSAFRIVEAVVGHYVKLLL